MFEELIAAWDGEEVVVRHDTPSGAWIFVGVHSTVLGPGFGGTRMTTYQAPVDALRDVLRLSSAMTSKNALARLPFGGGKAVIAVPGIPTGEERRELLERYGDVVAALGGTYRTACDMNTVDADMDVVATRAPGFVLGRTEAAGGSGSSGRSTALGVFHGIRASLAHAVGSDDPAGRSVLVQGTGDVGEPLAEHLAEAGASVLLSDVVEERARALADRIGGTVVPADEAISTECDAFAPCAVGGVVNSESIPRLRCRVVAGGANNQLETPEDAGRLRDAGILYATDYAINAGGVLHLAGLEMLGWDRTRLGQRLAGIGETLGEIFAAADADGVDTETAAARIVEVRLRAGRAGGATTRA